MTNAINTKMLNDGKTLVLARNDKQYGVVCCTYTNYRQAYNALIKVWAMGIKAGIYDRGRVKFVRIIEA